MVGGHPGRIGSGETVIADTSRMPPRRPNGRPVVSIVERIISKSVANALCPSLRCQDRRVNLDGMEAARKPPTPRSKLLADPGSCVHAIKPGGSAIDPTVFEFWGTFESRSNSLVRPTFDSPDPPPIARLWWFRSSPGGAGYPDPRRFRWGAARCRRSGKVPAASRWSRAFGGSSPARTKARLRSTGCQGRWRSSGGRRLAHPGRPNRWEGFRGAQTRRKNQQPALCSQGIAADGSAMRIGVLEVLGQPAECGVNWAVSRVPSRRGAARCCSAGGRLRNSTRIVVNLAPERPGRAHEREQRDIRLPGPPEIPAQFSQLVDQLCLTNQRRTPSLVTIISSHPLRRD